jgi:hypothetical protein
MRKFFKALVGFSVICLGAGIYGITQSTGEMLFFSIMLAVIGCLFGGYGIAVLRDKRKSR